MFLLLVLLSRYKSLSFACDEACLLHGFCGSFLSVLFGDVTLSTVPENPTPQMNSWFPLFLPLGAPVTVARGDVVTVHVWRCVGPIFVWYEWCLTSPITTPVQNSQGQSYWIGL